MTISLLRINDFRNIATLEIIPEVNGLNIIHGCNGSGKSSLLEAIHFASLGKTFRSGPASTLIRYNAPHFSLFAQLVHENDCSIPIAIERNTQGQMRMRMAEKDIKSAIEFTNLLPLRLINSQSHQLFESGPQFRRKFIDWGLFYQNVQFLAVWRNFERVLKQRNQLLATWKPNRTELNSWTSAVVEYGSQLHQLRLGYIQGLTPQIEGLAKQLLNITKFELKYYAGWDANYPYADILAESQEEDVRIGYTQYGPQRADMMIKTDGILAKHYLSRGQQKLLICAMILAQGLMLTKIANKRLIYLVDDLPAELDFESRKRLISLLINQQTQVFITAIEQQTICDSVGFSNNVPMRVFHVEQGRVITK